MASAGRRTAAAGGDLQRRADGAARPEARQRPSPDAATWPRPAPAATRRERSHPRQRLQPAHRGGAGESPHHAGRRVAARQLPPDRRADPHGEAPPAAGLQPRAAAAGERRLGRLAARLRHRARADLARDGRVDPESLGRVRRRVPDDPAAQARRAVGDPDHAAARADREPAARRQRDVTAGRVDRDLAALGRPDDRASPQADPRA